MAYVKSLNRSSTDSIVYERHHIIPRSIDPSLIKNSNNIVLLTLREHYLAHLTLYKMYEGTNKKKMALALDMLRKSKKYYITSSRLFGKIRLEANVYQSERQKGIKLTEKHKQALSEASAWKGGPSPFKGKKHAEEAKEKNRLAHLHRVPWNKGIPRDWEKYPMSEETYEKLSKANLGRTLSEEHIHKISEGHKGLSHSEETKKKISSRIERYHLYTGKRWYGYNENDIPENCVTHAEYKKSPYYKRRKYAKNKKNQ